jgi:hypothetical protein
MNIHEAADLFERVRWRGTQRFTARCPAHEDRSPSLSVREGHSSIMVKCFAGCTFLEVAAAVGVQPIDFKIGGGTDNTSSAHTYPSIRARLRQVLRRPELKTLEDVATLALHPMPAQSTRAAERYPDLMNMPYEEAMRYHTSVMDGPVFELLRNGQTIDFHHPGYYPRYETDDWYEARDKATKEMAETWRRR